MAAASETGRQPSCTRRTAATMKGTQAARCAAARSAAAWSRAVLALRARNEPGLDTTASALRDIPRLPAVLGPERAAVTDQFPRLPGNWAHPATSRLGFPGKVTAFIPSTSQA